MQPRSRHFALLLIILALAACGRERARRQPAPYQIGGAVCLRALAARGIRADPWAAPESGACRVDTPVRSSLGASAGLKPPVQTSCAMLVAWSDLEPEMQAAATYYLGSRVVNVRNYGSYSCRGMKGNGDTLSLHASARALDVSGFELADGRTVTVAEGWDGPRPEQHFLRAVRDAACRRYGVVLSPDRDRDHRDHLHLDIGPWRLCG